MLSSNRSDTRNVNFVAMLCLTIWVFFIFNLFINMLPSVDFVTSRPKLTMRK